MLFSPRNLLQQHGPYIKKVQKKNLPWCLLKGWSVDYYWLMTLAKWQSGWFIPLLTYTEDHYCLLGYISSCMNWRTPSAHAGNTTVSSSGHAHCSHYRRENIPTRPVFETLLAGVTGWYMGSPREITALGVRYMYRSNTSATHCCLTALSCTLWHGIQLPE